MYKIIEIVTVGQLEVSMGNAEREGYTFVGAVANPGDSVVIMYREGAVPAEKREEGGISDPLLRMSHIHDLLREAVVTDGAHHKQWYLERIAGELVVVLPEHDEGIAP